VSRIHSGYAEATAAQLRAARHLSKKVARFQLNRLCCNAATFSLLAATSCTVCRFEGSLHCYALLFRIVQLFLQLLDAYPKLAAALSLIKAAPMMLWRSAWHILTESIRGAWV